MATVPASSASTALGSIQNSPPSYGCLGSLRPGTALPWRRGTAWRQKCIVTLCRPAVADGTLSTTLQQTTPIADCVSRRRCAWRGNSKAGGVNGCCFYALLELRGCVERAKKSKESRDTEQDGGPARIAELNRDFEPAGCSTGGVSCTKTIATTTTTTSSVTVAE